jgi:ligand-binding SRPBCC domain-containing protein
MTLHHLEAELWVPRRREEIFPFFADAHNLETITPPWLHFEVLTPRPVQMCAGAEIDYRLRVHGIPMRWQSEITLWEPPARFIDEQRNGPYRRWVHQHLFEEAEGGTRCRDLVEYAVPGGAFIHWLLVRRDVDKIFAFRRQAIQALFP